MSPITQLIDVAQGLVYLHSHEIVHGNLKQVCHSPDYTPSSVLTPRFIKQNILVDSAGRARLSDIGFAKLTRNRGSQFDWADVGADGYRWAAPEIFKSGELSKQSDVFSYGFVAAEVRSLTVPLRRRDQHPPLRYSLETSYGKESVRLKRGSRLLTKSAHTDRRAERNAL